MRKHGGEEVTRLQHDTHTGHTHDVKEDLSASIMARRVSPTMQRREAELLRMRVVHPWTTSTKARNATAG